MSAGVIDRALRLSPLRAGIIGLALAGSALFSGARAQFFFDPFSSPFSPPGPIFRHPGFVATPYGFLSPGEVFDEVIHAGYRPIRLLGRNGHVFIVDAQTRRGQPVRLIVHALSGDIVERFEQGPPPAQRRVARKEDPGLKARPELERRTTPLPPAPPASNGAVLPHIVEPVAPPVARAPDPPAKTSKRRMEDWAPINAVPPAPLE
jgi:hypothetical protein